MNKMEQMISHLAARIANLEIEKAGIQADFEMYKEDNQKEVKQYGKTNATATKSQ